MNTGELAETFVLFSHIFLQWAALVSVVSFLQKKANAH